MIDPRCKHFFVKRSIVGPEGAIVPQSCQMQSQGCAPGTAAEYADPCRVKVLIVFGTMTFSEIMQLFGIYFFGVTFDIIDILMYAIAAVFASFIDKKVFENIIPNWRLD